MKFNNFKIVSDDNELIRRKSEIVSLPLSDEDKQLLMDMLNYVRASQNAQVVEEYGITPAVGIAAIQVGVPKKMLAIVVPYGEDDVDEFALVNAKIISESKQKTYLKDGEACLSVPNTQKGYVPRAARIKVKAYDLLSDAEIIIEADDYLAIVLQHEIDHFSGKLYYDHINKNNPWEEIEDAIVI